MSCSSHLAPGYIGFLAEIHEKVAVDGKQPLRYSLHRRCTACSFGYPHGRKVDGVWRLAFGSNVVRRLRRTLSSEREPRRYLGSFICRWLKHCPVEGPRGTARWELERIAEGAEERGRGET
ncbi:uncharacterized protein LOC105687657 [Athalia rosae]|uniref:uncharacterized protein LOC105687657 n=1 Tax=Athalia rosae TaxID=37344 RepID=UPI002033E9A4|nr:uncharacterized protein LOC105687657 [Athalia rosae]XP_048510058.1 uncharacterized protein LOC105687657 [Athalia rosae]XP_048510059.1 uncharacterized protein LOC105687657 [Athalia rosae]